MKDAAELTKQDREPNAKRPGLLVNLETLGSDIASKIATHARAQGSALGTNLEGKIRDNPVAAAIAAFGAGTLLAALLTRRQ